MQVSLNVLKMRSQFLDSAGTVQEWSEITEWVGGTQGWHFILCSLIRCNLFKNPPCAQEKSSIISQKDNTLGGGGCFYN